MKVLVTGASEGIGGAIARHFARWAAESGELLSITLSTSGRNGEPAKLIGDLEAAGAKVNYAAADLSKREDCLALADSACEFAGGLDHFVSNAGAMRSRPLKELSADDWDFLFATNVRAAFLIAQRLYPALKESSGTVTAVSSVNGHVPGPGTGGYAPSKAALDMLVRQMSQEWAADGIRINAVAPGMIRTPLTERAYLDPETHAARLGLVPMRKIGTVDDVANAVCFLASPQAGYITGQIITLDGGFIDSIYHHLPALKQG